ncbi:hypothetical protein [Mycolicibacterium mengxianglii]|uniref:hypothetical protein n=1 Tax=Mycolicibacterium mengxianglii TaxID=2736649 RepID=UPI0018CFF4E2|nr:hypothetical protein [Mycolicibacterium mengxianglii]
MAANSKDPKDDSEQGVQDDDHVAASRAGGGDDDESGSYVGRTGSDDAMDAGETGAEARAITE